MSFGGLYLKNFTLKTVHVAVSKNMMHASFFFQSLWSLYKRQNRMQSLPGDIPGIPHAQGLYDPEYEHDACGVGYIVSIDGVKSHKVIE